MWRPSRVSTLDPCVQKTRDGPGRRTWGLFLRGQTYTHEYSESKYYKFFTFSMSKDSIGKYRLTESSWKM